MAIEITRHGDCALVTLNRPDALNALTFQIIRDIGAAFDEAAGIKGVRALLVTGAGQRAFCAGADIRELRNRGLIDQKRGSELGQSIFSKLDTLPIPSI